MTSKRSAIALGAIVALSAMGIAGAATNTYAPAATQASCDALMKQADSALATHKGDTKAKAAQPERDKGDKECKAGRYDKGAEHLRRAITDLGMKPVN